MADKDSQPLLTLPDRIDHVGQNDHIPQNRDENQSLSIFQACQEKAKQIQLDENISERAKEIRGIEAFRKLILKDIEDLTVIKNHIAGAMRYPGCDYIIYYGDCGYLCLDRRIFNPNEACLRYGQAIAMFLAKNGEDKKSLRAQLRQKLGHPFWIGYDRDDITIRWDAKPKSKEESTCVLL